jgi:hypothetical protein
VGPCPYCGAYQNSPAALAKREKKEKEHRLVLKGICPQCQGKRRCSACKGEGKVHKPKDDLRSTVLRLLRIRNDMEEVLCSACRGMKRCPVCNGQGSIKPA